MLRWWICSTTKKHNGVKGHRGNVWNQKQSELGLSALKQKEREARSVHSSFVCKIFYPECFACCSVCCRGGGSKRPSWQGAHSPQTWPADPARSPHNRGRRLNPTLPPPRPRRFLRQRKKISSSETNVFTAGGLDQRSDHFLLLQRECTTERAN